MSKTNDKYRDKPKQVQKNLFGEDNPMDEVIRINKVPFTVIGLLDAKGGTAWADLDDTIEVPLKTAKQRLVGKKFPGDQIRSMTINVSSTELLFKTEKDVRGFKSDLYFAYSGGRYGKLELNHYTDSFYFDEESNLRGGHYDDKCLPYIATALVAGKWNIGEYQEELDALAEEYDVDLSVRGFFN